MQQSMAGLYWHLQPLANCVGLAVGQNTGWAIENPPHYVRDEALCED